MLSGAFGKAFRPPFDPGLATAIDYDALILALNPIVWVKSDTGLYKDAAKTQAATIDGDLIYTWDDQGTNNKDFVQATEARRPALKFVASVPFVRTTADNATTGDAMQASSIGTSTARTLFVVVKKNSIPDTSSRSMVSFGNTASVFTKFNLNGNNDYEYETTQTTTYPSLGGTSTTLSVICLVYASASSLAVYVDGTPTATLDPHDLFSTSTNLYFGMRSGNGQAFDGDYAEILLFNTALSDANRQMIETYLAGRWTNPT